MLTHFPNYCIGNQMLFCFEETVLSHSNQFSIFRGKQATNQLNVTLTVNVREAETYSHNERLIGPCSSHSHKRSGTGSQACKAIIEKTGYRVRLLHNQDLFIHQPDLSFSNITKESMENGVTIKFPQKTMTKLILTYMIERRRQIQRYSSDLIS